MLNVLLKEELAIRPRRNRKSSAIRELVKETYLSTSDLVYPLFVREGRRIQEPILSMPGINRFSLDTLIKEVHEAVSLGINALALFPVISKEEKDKEGSQALNRDGILHQAIRLLKQEFPQICVIADVALDPYTSHGHDGVVNEEGEILNDETVLRLEEMALIQAEVGIDIVAPSDMMDGRVKAIRRRLDASGFSHVSILSYSVKYASSFYGPFREALSSKLIFGDKKTYQMDPANRREALREALLDVAEGADILMIKPALPYLDILSEIRKTVHLPMAAYHVSGEYAMLKAASANGWLDGDKALLESLLCIKRAGADMIFSYGAKEVAKLIKGAALY